MGGTRWLISPYHLPSLWLPSSLKCTPSPTLTSTSTMLWTWHARCDCRLLQRVPTNRSNEHVCVASANSCKRRARSVSTASRLSSSRIICPSRRSSRSKPLRSKNPSKNALDTWSSASVANAPNSWRVAAEVDMGAHLARSIAEPELAPPMFRATIVARSAIATAKDTSGSLLRLVALCR